MQRVALLAQLAMLHACRDGGLMMKLDVQLGMVESLARQRADGHLTLLRFTTGWKIALGTPDLDSGAGRHEVAALPNYGTLDEALDAFVAAPVYVPEVDVDAIRAAWFAEALAA